MDLTARVEALEEEMAVLKGEIKLILQEVRVAILARDNPFADHGFEPAPVGSHEPPAFVSPESPGPKVVFVGGQDAFPSESGAAASMPLPAPVIESGNRHADAHASRPATPPRITLLGEEQETPRRQRRHRRELASLMAWTQETAVRFSRHDFALVLSIACYGELIDEELKQTLLDVTEPMIRDDERRATISDFMLAVHQLEAFLGDEHQTSMLTREYAA